MKISIELSGFLDQCTIEDMRKIKIIRTLVHKSLLGVQINFLLSPNTEEILEYADAFGVLKQHNLKKHMYTRWFLIRNMLGGAGNDLYSELRSSCALINFGLYEKARD